VREKESDHLLSSVDRRSVEGRESSLLPSMDVGAVREQLPHDLDVAPRDRGVQRGDLRRVARGEVRIRAGREEQSRRLDVPEERGETERREPVGGDGVPARRVLAEQPTQAFDVPDGARLENVENDSSREEYLPDPGLSVIDGGQEGRGAGGPRREQRGVLVDEPRNLIAVSLPDRVEQPLGFVHGGSYHRRRENVAGSDPERGRIPPPMNFGLSSSEAARLRRLSPPWRIQKFLDELEYDVAGAGCRSPRRVLSERRVQCMDGALFAAAALRVQGERPLILDLEAVQDDDHVIALYRRSGLWGAVARSNYSGLRFREPLFATVRDLVLSYVEGYFNLRRQKTLRRYSRPFDLSRFDRIGWMTSEEDLWEIPNHLVGIRHRRLLTPSQERALAPVSKVVFGAGLVGRKGHSPKKGLRRG